MLTSEERRRLVAALEHQSPETLPPSEDAELADPWLDTVVGQLFAGLPAKRPRKPGVRVRLERRPPRPQITPPAEDVALPVIEDYDALSAPEVIDLVDALAPDELDEVVTYERTHAHRRKVLRTLKKRQRVATSARRR